MQKLSAVVVTYNEENNIERCLRSLLGVVDEIIVVDSFSSDRTKEICNQIGVKFITHRWQGFAEQKNFASTLAANDWILSIDADEALSDELKASITKVKKEFSGYYYRLNRLTNYCGRWIKTCGWYPEKRLRLFDRRSATWSGDFIHETVATTTDVTAPLLGGDLLHYSYPSIEAHVLRADSYSTLGARKLLAAGKTFSWLNVLFRPPFKFIKMFIFQRGFLDGYYGLCIAAISSYSIFLKYSKLRLLPTGANTNAELRVLHVSSEKSFRGGERQISFLLDDSSKNSLKHFVACKPSSGLETYCKNTNTPYLAVSLRNELDLVSAYRLKKFCRKHSISLIHAHSAHAHAISLWSHVLGNKIPIIISRRVDFPIKKNIFSSLKYNYSGISKILCVSDAVSKTVKRRLTDHSKCKTIHSAIDLTRYQATTKNGKLRESLYISHDTPIVATIGALTHEKDHFTFLRCAKLLKDKADLKFLIVGDGPFRARLETFATEIGLENDVIFTGFSTDIPGIFASIDVLLFTSKTEGFPNTILEAFATKVPVVATKAGGIVELVKHEETGLLAAVGDASALASETLKLLSDTALNSRLTENAAKFVQAFSKERLVREVTQVYLDVVGTPKS